MLRITIKLFGTAATIAIGALFLTAPAHADADLFIESDDYKEGEEVVGKFLTDDDYRVMVEDIERNDIEFDWGWVKSPSKKPDRPKQLGFDLGSYSTVTVPEVPNHHRGIVSDETPSEVHSALTQVMEQLGLEVVPSGGDLEFSGAIVDYKKGSTNVFFARIDPFIELELRLRDTGSGEDLLLLRHQDHADTPEYGAVEIADKLIRFLGE